MKDQIGSAFDKIKTTDAKKEYIFYEIQRNYDKKGYVSNKKLRFFKQRFDRYVPLVALCLILVCAFSFYGVSSGLFTGTPYKSTGEMLSEAGYDYTDEAELASEESTAGVSENTAADKTAGAAEPKSSAYSAEVISARIYSAMDIGYTLYEVTDVPADALALWGEIAALKAVPSTVSLESYSLESDTLTLNFNDGLQKIQDASPTTAVVCGIAKTYGEFYPAAQSVIVNSAGNPITFQGEPIDISALIAQEINITDTVTAEYSGQ